MMNYYKSNSNIVFRFEDKYFRVLRSSDLEEVCNYHNKMSSQVLLSLQVVFQDVVVRMRAGKAKL